MLGKACIWLGGAAMTMLALYFAALAIPKLPSWSPYVLFVGFVVVGIFYLLTGLAYLFLLGKKRLNPLEILGDWRCTYWPKEKHLKVSWWFRDNSGAASYSIDCIAQFTQQKVNVNDDVTVGGLYMGKSGIMQGRMQPIMVECFKRNVELGNVDTAIINVSMRPVGGVWFPKKKESPVAVQVISH